MKNAIKINITLIILAGVINVLHAQRKSEAVALGLSIGCPTVCCLNEFGLPLALSIAPSAGHYYAGQWGTGLIFTGLRITTLLVMAYPLLPDDKYKKTTGVTFTCIGVCGFITLIEWSMVPSSVEYHNTRCQIKPELNLQLDEYALGIAYHF